MISRGLITGVSGALSELATSADGAWRVAVEKNASAQKVAVWRSSNATTWTRIALPAGVTTGAVGILTNGNVIVARGNGTTASKNTWRDDEGHSRSCHRSCDELATGSRATILHDDYFLFWEREFTLPFQTSVVPGLLIIWYCNSF